VHLEAGRAPPTVDPSDDAAGRAGGGEPPGVEAGRLLGVLVEVPAALQPLAEAVQDPGFEGPQVVQRRAGVLDERERLILGLGVSAVQGEDMQMRVTGQGLGKSLDENDASAMELVEGSGLYAGEDAIDTPCQVRRRRSCKHSQGGSRRRREPTSKMRPRADTASPQAARSPTISDGGDRTYCRMGTSGSTRFTRWCAVS
jgi:hypothetical protein